MLIDVDVDTVTFATPVISPDIPPVVPYSLFMVKNVPANENANATITNNASMLFERIFSLGVISVNFVVGVICVSVASSTGVILSIFAFLANLAVFLDFVFDFRFLGMIYTSHLYLESGIPMIVLL